MPVGEWFYMLDFVFCSDVVICYLLEIIVRDGSFGLRVS